MSCRTLQLQAHLHSLDHLSHLHLGLALDGFSIHPGDLISGCQGPFQRGRRIVKHLEGNKIQLKADVVAGVIMQR